MGVTLKHSFFIFFCWLFLSSVVLGEHIFVLVDVSGSVVQVKGSSSARERESRAVQEMITEAKNLLVDLVSASYSGGKYPGWRVDLLAEPLEGIINAKAGQKPLAKVGDRFVMIPFGDLDTPGGQGTVISEPCEDFPKDFRNFIEQRYPRSYSDAQTYIESARAYTLKFARDHDMRSYLFFMVTDGLNSPAPETKFSKEQQSLLDEWDAKDFFERKYRIGKLKYEGNNLAHRRFEIDVWNVVLVPLVPNGRIDIHLPTSGNPILGPNVPVQFTPRDIVPGTTFSLTISKGNETVLQQDLGTETRTTLELPSGDYKLLVASNAAHSAERVFSVVGKLPNFPSPPPSPPEKKMELILPVTGVGPGFLEFPIVATPAPLAAELQMTVEGPENGFNSLEFIDNREGNNLFGKVRFLLKGDYKIKVEGGGFSATKSLSVERDAPKLKISKPEGTISVPFPEKEDQSRALVELAFGIEVGDLPTEIHYEIEGKGLQSIIVGDVSEEYKTSVSLPKGEFTITAKADGFLPASKNFTVAFAKEPGLNIDFENNQTFVASKPILFTFSVQGKELEQTDKISYVIMKNKSEYSKTCEGIISYSQIQEGHFDVAEEIKKITQKTIKSGNYRIELTMKGIDKVAQRDFIVTDSGANPMPFLILLLSLSGITGLLFLRKKQKRRPSTKS